jgi:stringent starvation protein A
MLTLYDAPRCPYCARVRIVLAEKGVAHDTVEVDLDDRPAWLYEKNPLGKVPVLETEDFALPESLVIMEFLEERYPEPALLPADPASRAFERLAMARFENALGNAYYAFRRGEVERLPECLAHVDGQLARSQHPFSLTDVAYVPWILRLRDLFGVDLAPYPEIGAWVERLSERPSVAAETALLAGL